jgi:hypothetical protein
MSVFSSAMNVKFVREIIHLTPIQSVLISVLHISIVFTVIVLIIANVPLVLAVMVVTIMEQNMFVHHPQYAVVPEVLINAKLLQQTHIVLVLQRVAMVKQKQLQQMWLQEKFVILQLIQ